MSFRLYGNTQSITAKPRLISTQNLLVNRSCSIMRYCLIRSDAPARTQPGGGRTQRVPRVWTAECSACRNPDRRGFQRCRRRWSGSIWCRKCRSWLHLSFLLRTVYHRESPIKLPFLQESREVWYTDRVNHKKFVWEYQNGGTKTQSVTSIIFTGGFMHRALGQCGAVR